MPTKNITVKGKVREVSTGQPPVSGATVTVAYDYNADEEKTDSTTTDSKGRYDLDVDLEASNGKVHFYIQATKNGCADTGRSRGTSSSKTTVNLDTTCS